MAIGMASVGAFQGEAPPEPELWRFTNKIVTTNVPDFNHHKGAKTLRTPRISKLFLFFVPLWLRVFVVSSQATLVVT
jgi:hypothetical protein